MAKLSNLFGRKSGEISAGRGNGNGDHHVIENFSDVGSRMGEENEALRNLLSDTGRKIGELDELKEAFDKIVAPFNSTLRALEQEKAQTLGLNGMLNESRAARRDAAHRILPDREEGNHARSRSRETAHRPRTGARVEPLARKHAPGTLQ